MYLFIQNRLDSTDSIQLLLLDAVKNIPEETKSTPIYAELEKRLAKCKRIGRRMRMKYVIL